MSEPTNEISARDAFTDAIRYWERLRIVYNLVLAAIVVVCYVAGLPASRDRLSWDLAQGLFLLAVLANVAYCTAYPVDVFAQLSNFRAAWSRGRWALFVIGLVFAGIVTRLVAQAMFA